MSAKCADIRVGDLTGHDWYLMNFNANGIRRACDFSYCGLVICFAFGTGHDDFANTVPL